MYWPADPQTQLGLIQTRLFSKEEKVRRLIKIHRGRDAKLHFQALISIASRNISSPEWLSSSQDGKFCVINLLAVSQKRCQTWLSMMSPRVNIPLGNIKRPIFFFFNLPFILKNVKTFICRSYKYRWWAGLSSRVRVC